jgi:hypothetical protein
MILATIAFLMINSAYSQYSYGANLRVDDAPENSKRTTAGWVYVTRKDGSKSIYTGMTTKSPFVRWGEHIRNVRNGNKSSWVGRGTLLRPRHKPKKSR